MTNPEPTKSGLHALLSQTFSKENRSKSLTKSRQSEELYRLKNICFPRKTDEHMNRSIDFGARNSRNEHNLPPRSSNKSLMHRQNKSVFIDKGRPSFIQTPEQSVNKSNDVSFNMSPLSPKQGETSPYMQEGDNSAIFEGEKSYVLDRTQKNYLESISVRLKTPRTDFEERPRMTENKHQAAKETLFTLTNHFTTEMIRFVNALTHNMKSVCLTKLAEKNIQMLLNKHLNRLEGLQTQWHKHLISEEDFRAGTKALVNILASCFEEILSKLSELLIKLKSFNGMDFNPMGTKGILLILTTVLQQDHTLSSYQVLLQGLQVLSNYTNSFAAMRLGYLLSQKASTQKASAFTTIKLHGIGEAYKYQESASLIASQILFNFLSKHTTKQQLSSFQSIKAYGLEKTLKQELFIQEGLKSLLSSLLKVTHNESRFFDTLNIFLSALTNCQYCELLLLDKPHQVAYGYPSGQMALKPLEKKEKVFNSTGKLEKAFPQDNNGGFSNRFLEQVESTEDSFSSKIELSYEKESLLKYVISRREVICSWNLPHISLYNREVDVPLATRNQRRASPTYDKPRFDKFVYFPVCNLTQEVIGVVRIFLNSEETIDQQSIEKLSRFSETITPLLETLIQLLRLSNLKDRSQSEKDEQQIEVLKKLVYGAMKITNLSDPAAILQGFSQLLIDLFHVENISLYHYNQDSSLTKLYSSDSNFGPKRQITEPNKLSNTIGNTLQISIYDPYGGHLVGVIELEGPEGENDWKNASSKLREKENTDPSNKVNKLNTSKSFRSEASASKRTYRDPNKFYLGSISPMTEAFLSSFGFTLLEKLIALLENSERGDLIDQLAEIQSVNHFLEKRIGIHEVLHEFTGRLQSCSSYRELVLAFNETLQVMTISADLGGLFFLNPNSSTFFTFNYLSNDPNDKSSKTTSIESLISFSKGDCVLGSLLDTVLKTGEILRINHEASVPHASNSQIDPSKVMSMDLQKEDVLVRLPLKSNETSINKAGKETWKSKNKPQTVLILPITLNTEGVAAFIVLAKCENEKPLNEEEEFFVKKMSESLCDFLSSQQKLSESLNEVIAKVERSQDDVSKMKAYQTLLSNQALQPEYQIFRKHKNIQSFILFLETTYRQVLKAQSSRILLFNEKSQSLYYYPKLMSPVVKELKQPLNSSITGISLLKNEVFIHPSLPYSSISHHMLEEEFLDSLPSHRLKSFRNQSSNKKKEDYVQGLNNTKAVTSFKGPSSYNDYLQQTSILASQHAENLYSGRPSSSNSQHSAVGTGPTSFLDESPHYNNEVDYYEGGTQQVLHSAREKIISFGDNTQEWDMPPNERTSTFICIPLGTETKKIIGIVQLFNKIEEGKVFGRKDLLKARTITDAIMSKLTELGGSPSKVVPKGFLKGLEKLGNLQKIANSKHLSRSFEKCKACCLPRQDENNGGKGLWASLYMLVSIGNNRLRKCFDQLKLHFAMQKLRADLMETGSYNQKKTTAIRLFHTIEKIAWKRLNTSMGNLKLLYGNISGQNLTDLHDETTRIKGYALKKVLEKLQERRKSYGLRALSDGYYEQERRSQYAGYLMTIQGKYLGKILSNFVREKALETKKAAFGELKLHKETQDYEKNVLQVLLENFMGETQTLRGCLSILTLYLRKIYHEYMECNISLVDTISEKGFWFNEKRVPEFMVGIGNRKQLKSLERIIQNKESRTYDSKSLFESGEGSKFACIAYVVIDLSDLVPFSKGFEDPYLLFEVCCKANTSTEISQQSKEKIKSLFSKSILGLKGSFQVLSTLSRKYNIEAAHRAFFAWKLSSKEAKNNEIIGQTSRAFRTVEEHMTSLEEDMKRYQQEIQEYDHKVKFMTEELESKNEQNNLLSTELEQLTLEKKAKTKCFSQHIKARTAFNKWKGLATSAKLTNNVFSKMAVVSRKHISARYQAAGLILTHMTKKYSSRILSSCFRMLVASSVSFSMLNKSAVLPDNNLSMSAYGYEEQRKSVPRERTNTQGKYDNLKVPYLPLRKNTHITNRLEGTGFDKKEERREEDSKFSIDLRSRLNESRISHASGELGSPNKSFGKSGTISGLMGKYNKNSKSSQGNEENEFLSRSPEHLSFIHYRQNLMEKSQDDIEQEKKKPMMSEKTSNFLRDFETNKYLRNRKTRDLLNKSDIGLPGQNEIEEGVSNQNLHFYKPVNHSFTGDENWNEKILFNNNDSLLN